MKPPANHSILLLLTLLLAPARAQETRNIAQLLGYPREAKLLIVHADDIGLAQSVNAASLLAFEKGGITSGSVMVPCPWFADFAVSYRENPDLDVGVHITLTAEWENYRWDGVSPSGEIRSLLDEEGYFYPSVEALGLHADPSEAEAEIRAQIERALAFGIRPTHLDTHMGSVMAKPELIQTYLALGREYGLPILFPRFMIQAFPPDARTSIEENNVLLDGLFMLEEAPREGSWEEAYGEMFGNMGPGLNQLIVHLGFDNEEMQAVSVNHPDFGSAWRQHDLDFVTSPEFREMLKQHGIHLVTWKQIKEVM